MALTTDQQNKMRGALQALLSANPYGAAPNVGDAALLGFWKQLGTDAGTGSALAAGLDQSIDFVFRSLLCGLVGRISDSDWLSFFTQLAVDASSAASLPSGQYDIIKRQLRAELSAYSLSPGTISDATLNGYLSARIGFSGNFGALFTGVIQYLRSDLGITQSTGNITAWADQSGSANVTPASGASLIGTVATGLNGHSSVLANGSNQGGQFTLALPAPGTTPTFIWAVMRLLSASNSPSYLTTDGGLNQSVFANNGTTDFYSRSSGNVGPATVSAGTWGRMMVQFSNNPADFIRFGSIVVTGNAGNNASSGPRGLFSSASGTGFLNAEALVWITLNNIPTAPQLAAADAAVTSFYGVSVGV